MSADGHHMGGVVGFLNSTKSLVELVHPSTVIVAWEGGGSHKRRAIFPEYKAHRRPPKLNRFYEGEIPDTAENRAYQVGALVALLKELPVCQVYIEDGEADDVIGYLCRNTLKAAPKVIASSDKDLYQLLDENTKIYSFTTKGFIRAPDVVDLFGISAANFAVAKAFCGDPSDGIPGIKGLGFKTLVKTFPQLGGEIDVSVHELIEQAKSIEKPSRVVARIVENADLIKRNFAIMYLDTSNLAPMQIRKIDAVVSSHVPKKNHMQFMRQLIKEGLQSVDAQSILSAFVSI